MKIPSWARNVLLSPEIRLSVVRAMRGDNWAVEAEERVRHCECGNDKVSKIFIRDFFTPLDFFIFRDAR